MPTEGAPRDLTWVLRDLRARIAIHDLAAPPRSTVPRAAATVATVAAE